MVEAWRTQIFLALGAVAVGAVCGVLDVDAAAVDQDFFESRIRPVLTEHCYSCHSAEAKRVKGGLLLDSREGALMGGDSGPAIVPGDPEASLLVRALLYQEDLEMPPDGRLGESVTRDFILWIAAGAPDPRDSPSAAKSPRADGRTPDSSDHWAFQTRRGKMELQGLVAAGSATPIDGLIARRQREAGLASNALARPETRLRRLYFDVIGLPPPVEVVREFVRDPSSKAYRDLTERLLQDPGFGERWGRRWLDLARYADTNGADENMAHPEAWRYRDYVIDSFNQDKPYDQFLKEQLAGDLLPDPGDEALRSAQWTATGFLALGPKMLAEQDKEKMVFDIVDEQLSVASRTFLGLSMECARCHDHKFDPITQEDYTALAGVFYSSKTMAHTNHVSRWVERELPTAANRQAREAHSALVREAEARVEELESQTAANQPEEDSEELKKARERLEALKRSGPDLARVMAVVEGAPTDLPVHIRGNHLAPGDAAIERGSPSTFAHLLPDAEVPEGRSGRLALAEWMVDPRHPLTARVLVNRIWLGYFGKGLVETPSDFGFRGVEPELPEVLDWLADVLIESGWSMKAVHREILQSRVYQSSSGGNLKAESIDPDNRLFWRQQRRRLEAEPIRDSILSVSGQLVTRREAQIPRDLASGNQYYKQDASRFESPVRAVYLPVVRAASYEMMATFDYTQPAAHAGTRASTIVPHQALFMMNSSLVHETSTILGKWLAQLDAAGQDVVEPLYLKLFARYPSQRERALIEEFMASTGTQESADRWGGLVRAALAKSEFLYID